MKKFNWLYINPNPKISIIKENLAKIYMEPHDKHQLSRNI